MTWILSPLKNEKKLTVTFSAHIASKLPFERSFGGITCFGCYILKDISVSEKTLKDILLNLVQ